MKVGFRKPSFKKSFKARTTGRIKRSVKRTLNPFYGKKGMGWAKNPKRALYNKVYKKTTFGVSDVARLCTPKFKKSKRATNATPKSTGYSTATPQANYRVYGFIIKALAVATAVVFGLPSLFDWDFFLLVVSILATVGLWKLGAKWTARAAEDEAPEEADEAKEKAPEELPLEADDLSGE